MRRRHLCCGPDTSRRVSCQPQVDARPPVVAAGTVTTAQRNRPELPEHGGVVSTAVENPGLELSRRFRVIPQNSVGQWRQFQWIVVVLTKLSNKVVENPVLCASNATEAQSAIDECPSYDAV